MSTRPLNRLAGATLATIATALALAAPAFAHGPETVNFSGGSLEGLWEDGARTQMGFENLHFEFDECGKLPNELICTWSIEITLHSGSKEGCPAVAASTTVIWTSDDQSGDGSVDSGVRTIPLPPCQSNSVAVSHSYRKTYGPWEGDEPAPYLDSGGGWSFHLLPLGSRAQMEQNIINASPPAHVGPMPVPPPALRPSPDCRSLLAGTTRFVLVRKGIGCHKAARIASSTRFGDTTPNGYRCMLKPAGGGRCVREGNPAKFLEWHRPRKGPGKAT